MTRLVVDASVAVKWIFPDSPDEPNVREALHVLRQIREGEVEVVQPPHWLAEVLGVTVRVAPAIAGDVATLLQAMDFRVAEGPEVYRAALVLAADLGHHLFDTLYHAVALCARDAVLVTADERYYRKAQARGGIRLLAEMGP